MNGITIIICCYNSSLKLPNTLEHLANQLVSSDLSYEVLIVDNASTDNTAELARLYWLKLNTNIQLRIVHETTPGLVYARICGVKAAKNDLLIFCDDDNWLREDYVQNAYTLMTQMPNVGALGGQSELAPGIKAPDWWKEHKGNYAVGKQLSETGYANKRGFVYGAGLVTRKSLAVKIFDSQYPLLLTGRKGEQCLSGEDWEYCQRMLLLGKDLYYSEDLFYWHDITNNRLTDEKLHQLLNSFKAAKSVSDRYEFLIDNFHKSYLNNLLLVLKRIVIYIYAKPKYRKRKLDLLRFQNQICRFNFMGDAIIKYILDWIKKCSK